MKIRTLCYCLTTLLTVVLSVVRAYPDGAPDAACDTMTPQHDNTPSQTTTPPYSISLSSTTVNVGETIEVTVSADAGTTYKGLLLKAVAVGSDTGAVGSFIINAEYTSLYHTLNCSSSPESAVTHNSNTHKATVKVAWTAPLYNGNFIFAATAVKEYYTFWANFTSTETIEVVGGSAE